MKKENVENRHESLLIQQKELEKSLKYARNIQRALLPSESQIKYLFPEFFLLYLPKDIVSGDFYWIHHDNEKIIVAVGDSTGHGVPGAFVSVLGISFLQLVFSKHKPKNPAIALNYLREYFMKSLDQTGEEGEQKDGIDMSICFIYKNSNIVQYAGAFNPMYIVNSKEIVQVPGDNMPIGIGAEFENSFTLQEEEWQQGDMIYLFTDGFPDQFGGPKDKKFKYRPFRSILHKISSYNLDDQHKTLLEEHNHWKGDNIQLDDITILGIRNVLF